MIRILKIASAFIAVIVGAGFASGQEILLFFTSFGVKGIFSVSIATVLFTYFGMILLKIGSRLKARSHEEVFHKLSGVQIGTVMDIVITCGLFGVGVVMISGAGSIVEQQFGLMPVIGSLSMSIVLILTLMLDVEKIMTLLGLTVPFLMIAIIFVSVYSMVNMELDISILSSIARTIPSPVPNSLFSAINYVSFNITLGAGMAFLIGSAEEDERKAVLGGLLGGLVVGILVFLIHLAMLAQIDQLLGVEMPLLLLMNNISTKLGNFMMLVLLAMIYSTAVGMFYTFISRFFNMQLRSRYIPIIVTVFSGFLASFVGFSKLVALLYPLIGYFGLILMIILINAPRKLKQEF